MSALREILLAFPRETAIVPPIRELTNLGKGYPCVILWWIHLGRTTHLLDPRELKQFCKQPGGACTLCVCGIRVDVFDQDFVGLCCLFRVFGLLPTLVFLHFYKQNVKKTKWCYFLQFLGTPFCLRTKWADQTLTRKKKFRLITTGIWWRFQEHSQPVFTWKCDCFENNYLDTLGINTGRNQPTSQRRIAFSIKRWKWVFSWKECTLPNREGILGRMVWNNSPNSDIETPEVFFEWQNEIKRACCTERYDPEEKRAVADTRASIGVDTFQQRAPSRCSGIIQCFEDKLWHDAPTSTSFGGVFVVLLRTE